VTALTGFDIAIIAIVVLSAAFAFSRGLVREALSIAAWVLAAIGAFYAFPYVVPYADRFLPKGAVANAVAASGVFIVALAVLHVIARALASRVKNSPLSTVDRTLGLLFGLARGLVLACVVYMAVGFFIHANEPQPHWLAGSRTIPYLAAGAGRLEQLFSRASHSTGPGTATVEKEAEKAISAFTNPASSQAPHPADQPLYTPGEQRDLNRLIQQQNSE